MRHTVRPHPVYIPFCIVIITNNIPIILLWVKQDNTSHSQSRKCWWLELLRRNFFHLLPSLMMQLKIIHQGQSSTSLPPSKVSLFVLYFCSAWICSHTHLLENITAQYLPEDIQYLATSMCTLTQTTGTSLLCMTYARHSVAAGWVTMSIVMAGCC